MCKICGKVMHSDNLKCHMTFKHGNINNTLHHRKCPPDFEMITNNKRHNNELLVEGFKVKEQDDSLMPCNANLKSVLQRDDEVYQKNVDMGEQISILLENENIREKSLSKQNKFCLDLFHAQQAPM